MLLRLGRGLLFATYTILAASLLLFSVFECVPSLLDSVNLQSIAYYALKRELIADPTLVFVLRKVDYVLQTTSRGGSVFPGLWGGRPADELCRDDQC